MNFPIYYCQFGKNAKNVLIAINQNKNTLLGPCAISKP